MDASPAEIRLVHKILDGKQRNTFKMYGKTCTMHRLMALYGRSQIKFSGITLQEEKGEMPELVKRCLDYVADIDRQQPDRYWALVNWYPEATDYISPHTDDESDVGVVNEQQGPAVATFSFCQVPRTFRIERKENKRRWDVALPNGSCAIMTGHRFQQDFTHEVRPLSKRQAKQAAYSNLSIGRLSVTVRANPAGDM